MKSSNIAAIAGESGEPLDVARGSPRIEGLTMRRFENADVPARVAWMNDERTRQYMSLPNNVSPATTIAWLRRVRKTPGRYDFTVTRIGSDSPVAMLGLTPRDGEGNARALRVRRPRPARLWSGISRYENRFGMAGSGGVTSPRLLAYCGPRQRARHPPLQPPRLSSRR